MTTAAILTGVGDLSGAAELAGATLGCLGVEVGSDGDRVQLLTRWSDPDSLAAFLDAEADSIEVVARFDSRESESGPGIGWLAAGATDIVRRFLADPEGGQWLAVDTEGMITEASGGVADLVGLAPSALAGRPVAEILTEPDAATVAAAAAGDLIGPVELLLNFAGPTGDPETLLCRLLRVPGGALILGAPPMGREIALRRQLLELNDELAVLSRDNARKAREIEAARAELERTVADLNTSYWHLKKIQEVLPICMECGRVKTGELQWETVVDYLKTQSLFLSHGFCPDCARRHEIEIDET